MKYGCTESLALRHMRLWLQVLNRVLASALARQQEENDRFAGTELRGDCITSDHAQLLLDDAVRQGQAGFPILERLCLTENEHELETALLAEAESDGSVVPIRHLEESGFSDSEIATVVITAAPEFGTPYTRLYGYIVDDLTRCGPTVELVLRLTTDGDTSELSRRTMLSPRGRLRARRMLVDEASDAPSELHTRLKLGPGMLDWLVGACATAPFAGEDVDLIDPSIGVYPAEDRSQEKAMRGRLSRGGVVGVWGQRHEGLRDVVYRLAAGSRRWLYRLNASSGGLLESYAAARDQAAFHDAALWIDVDAIRSAHPPADLAALGRAIAYATVPVVLAGREPWRPAQLLELGIYTEIDARCLHPNTSIRLSGSTDHEHEALTLASAPYRFDTVELRSALMLARNSALGETNGTDLVDSFRDACHLVGSPSVTQYVDIVSPRRGLHDLVLAEDLHRQVAQIADMYQSTTEIDERWGFGHMTASPGGLKVLFTGESGTGKTLAAEAIAASLNRALLKVDLAQVVSKWVGETQQHLAEVFSYAEGGHGVLFFDEADALFGKRGEIRHGTDRYANLEVGYLLQRLEGFRGLVILASNLRDEIDKAFTRRFQVTLHFPRPGPEERRRLWSLAFSRGAPLDRYVEIDQLASIELTGAAIVDAARLSGLIARADRSGSIRASHIREAVSRQLHQQARLMHDSALEAFETPNRH